MANAGGEHEAWHVPDLFFAIISRLPISQISESRRISKWWKASIDGEHFSRAFAARFSSSTCLISFTGYHDTTFLLVNLETNTSFPLPHPPNMVDDQPLQSVQGVICFEHDDRQGIGLWNPFSRLLKALPHVSHDNLPLFSHLPPQSFESFSALGFDPSANDLVVIKTWICTDHETRVVAGHHIFRCKMGQWRTLARKMSLKTFMRSIWINDRIYFLIIDEANHIGILAFILPTEEFVTVTLPQTAVVPVKDEKMELIDWGGRLALTVLVGSALSIYIREGQFWIEHRFNLDIIKYYEGFIGSVLERKLVIAPRCQVGGLRLLLCNEHGNLREVAVQGFPIGRTHIVLFERAPINYVPSTFWI